MAADALEHDGRSRRVAGRGAAAADQRDLAVDRDAVDAQLPADDPRQRVESGLVERERGERAEARDAGRVVVEALRLGADHGRLDPARAALEDVAVAVDEEVVTDVVPAVGLDVVAGDAEHDPRRLLGRVLDRAGGVMDERGLHGAVARAAARRDLVGAPAGARDHERGGLRGAGLGLARRVVERAHEPRRELPGLTPEAELELVGGAGEGGIGAVERDVRVGEGGPARPAAAFHARPDLRLDVGARVPAQADEVEAVGRPERLGELPAGGVELADPELEQGRVGRGLRVRGGGEAERAEGDRAESQDMAAGEVHRVREHRMVRFGAPRPHASDPAREPKEGLSLFRFARRWE